MTQRQNHGRPLAWRSRVLGLGTIGMLVTITGWPQQAAPRPNPSASAGIAAPEVPPISSLGSIDSAAPTSHAEAGAPATRRLQPTRVTPGVLGFLGPFRRPQVPELFPGSGARLRALVHDDKLYLSVHDAIALAIENNLDVEIERDNLQLADTDFLRARGGGSLRGIDYTVQQTPNGVGGPGSPLLNSAAVNINPTTPSITDLTSLTATNAPQTNLSLNGAGVTYSTGPSVPLFDPSVILTGGYFRRSNTVSLVSTATSGTDAGTGGNGSGVTTQPQALAYAALNAAYVQGFSTGAQISATINNDSQVIYATKSESDPFYSPSSSVTLTQPLLRGRGRAVNLRYLRVANLDRGISRLLFEQQVLDTIYGVSRIYYDLVSLGENVTVKAEALRAAEKLRQDDAEQVIQGTLAPIELTRAAALVSSSQFDLVQAQGLYRQEEVILRDQLLRTGSSVFAASFTEIVPTDRILVPVLPDTYDVGDLVRQGLSRRPDLAQADLQIQAGQVNVQASRNQVLPQLNLFGNAQARGSAETAYEQLGSPGTGVPTIPQNLALGGLRTSTIYQGGVQLTLPLRNRIAASDAARDAIQLRQARARSERLGNQVRRDIENAVIAVETAYTAYKASATSREYQAQLLETERDKLEFGQSTNLLVIQNETYLAQARSTEIAAQSNWVKARIDLDHSIGDLLEKNGIVLEDAIQGSLP